MSTEAARADDWAALAAARSAVRGTQDGEGGWPGEFATGGTSWESADILLRHLLDAVDPTHVAAQRNWIVSQQNDDGGFPLWTGGPSKPSVTVLTHVALQLAGYDDDRERLDRAARFVRANGGIEAAEFIPTRFWLAFAGVTSWDEVPAVPPELILLPSWFPGNVNDFEPLAREIVVAVGILAGIRPVRRLPIDVEPLRRDNPAAFSPRTAVNRAAAGAALGTARALRRLSPPPLRQAALRRSERWLLSRQESDGSWGGTWTETMVVVLTLWSLGYGSGHPVVRKALDACASYAIEHGDTRRVLVFPSTVMNTALTLRALAAGGGRAGSDPVVDRAVHWLMTHRSDSTHNAPHPPAMVWDYEGIPTINPDVDDTAMVIAALHRLDVPRSPEVAAAIAEGLRWILAGQSPSGGWTGYGVDHWSLLGKGVLAGISFIEQPSPCVTAHIVETLHLEGLGWHPATRRAVRWLLGRQEPEGSWPARWGGRLYGTSQVLVALAAAGYGSGHPAVAAGMEWIYQHQNDDGGWGEDIPSTLGTTEHGTGESTVVQTAFGVVAAYASGLVDAQRVEAAVAYLLKHQDDDGGWSDTREWFVVIPNNVYSLDQALTNAFALWALALHARHTERKDLP
ncbi:prenyltransferase/squalene oxidase repeat-containing protein [Streptomyces sp. NPDC058953]|uniref:prenyltransferase/squalene oxidase repeat-containing protein n=1 Tax=unclassified Streptomyces TaxID=2593676 RepID=UPI0036B3AEF8